MSGGYFAGAVLLAAGYVIEVASLLQKRDSPDGKDRDKGGRIIFYRRETKRKNQPVTGGTTSPFHCRSRQVS